MSEKKNLLDLIKEASSIGIFTHTNPDGDAISSCMALQRFLEENYNKKSSICIAGEIGKLYKPFLKHTKIEKPNSEKPFDLAICLDCPEPFRMGEYESAFHAANNKANIDHHDTGSEFGEINFKVGGAASTTQILFHLFKKWGGEISDFTAMLLYTGIITDTNCFTQGNFDDQFHAQVGQLLKKNFNQEKIKDYFFVNNSKSKILLLEKALKNMQFALRDKLCLMKLTLSNFRTSNATFEDTMGIVDYGIKTAGVEVAVMLIERQKNFYYASIRSKGDVCAANIAKELNGGGHKNMAAFQYRGDLQELYPALIASVKKELLLNGKKKTERKNKIDFLQ